jgi:hypothetical protein
MVEHRLKDEKSLFFCLNTDLFFESESQISIGHPHKNGTIESWTTPSWFTEGDISFFYHSRRAFTHSRRIYNKLRARLEERNDQLEEELHHVRSLNDRLLIVLETVARRGYEFAQKYNGKIFAIGRACGNFERNTPASDQHWKSNCYSGYDKIFVLDHPIDYDDFRKEVSLEQKAITPLTRKQFDFLRELILRNNTEIGYLNELQHRDMRMSDVSQQKGWRSVANELDVSFLFEAQTREYLLDSFVNEIADVGTKLHTEVPSEHQTEGSGLIDYVISFCGNYLPVEAKCSIFHSDDLYLQLKKYTEAQIVLGKSRHVTCRNCLLVDSKNLFLFNELNDSQSQLLHLGTLKQLSLLSRDAIIAKIQESLYATN